MEPPGVSHSGGAATDVQPRLRVLCLHGFRQTASQFRGRTAALSKRLRAAAELIFIDAPHELPALAKEPGATLEAERNAETVAEMNISPAAEEQTAQARREAAKVTDGTLTEIAGLRECTAERLDERQGTAKITHVPEEARAAPKPSFSSSRGGSSRRASLRAFVPRVQGTAEGAERCSRRQPTQARKRRAWLVLPEQYGDSSADAVNVDSLNDQQYHLQTAGWEESAESLIKALQEGEFDGVLGFSQGAGIAAALAALECQNRPSERRQLKFVICCSGYVPAAPEVEELLQACTDTGGIPLPSLHVYGADAHDRQITSADAAALAQCFAPDRQQLLRHPGGHFIPGTKDAAQHFLRFLQQFS